jgi:MYXO-CTERM domain-containing protein
MRISNLAILLIVSGTLLAVLSKPATASTCAPDPEGIVLVTLPQDEEVAPKTPFRVYYDVRFDLSVVLNGEELTDKSQGQMPAVFELPSGLERGNYTLEVSADSSTGYIDPSEAVTFTTHAFTVGTPPAASTAPQPVLLGLDLHYTNDNVCRRVESARVPCPEHASEIYDVVIEQQDPSWFYALETVKEDQTIRRDFQWPGDCPVLVDLKDPSQKGCHRVVAIHNNGTEITGPTVCDLQPPISQTSPEPDEQGCAVSSHSPGRPSPWPILLAVLALPWVRRFRPQR